MQKFGGVRVLPLLPANMRRHQEEEEEESAVGFHDGDNGAGGGVEATTQKQKDSKKEVKGRIDEQNVWAPNSSDGALQVAKTLFLFIMVSDLSP